MTTHICVSLVPLFQELTEEEQIKINRLARYYYYAKGELVFKPGEQKLVIVARGSMKIYQISSSGKEQLLRITDVGGYEGENQLFGSANTNLFGEALEPTEICTLSKSDFDEILLNYPELMLKLLEISAQKASLLEQQTQFLSMEKIEERLVTYLLHLSRLEESLDILLPMKMKDLAAFLGTTPETLSRKLKFLELEGLIQRRGRKVTIFNKDALEEI